MAATTLLGRGHRLGQRLGEAHVVGQFAEQPGPGMGHHALAASGHHDAVVALLRFISEVPS